MTWSLFLTMSHILGTALGVGGATLAEIFYLKAAKDGAIDPTENSFLKTTYTVMRVGMIILVLSGFGFFLLLRFGGRENLILQPRFIVKLAIILILLMGVLAWQKKIVPAWLGSAVSLTSWYAAMILGIWRGLKATYFEMTAVFIAACAIVALVLYLIRKRLGIRL